MKIILEHDTEIQTMVDCLVKIGYTSIDVEYKNKILLDTDCKYIYPYQCGNYYTVNVSKFYELIYAIENNKNIMIQCNTTKRMWFNIMGKKESFPIALINSNNVDLDWISISENQYVIIQLIMNNWIEICGQLYHKETVEKCLSKHTLKTIDSEILYNVEILGKCYDRKEILELIALNQFGDAL